MADHDPLCSWSTCGIKDHGPDPCIGVAVKIRDDERERIASLLEDYGYGDAAMIARNGDSRE